MRRILSADSIKALSCFNRYFYITGGYAGLANSAHPTITQATNSRSTLTDIYLTTPVPATTSGFVTYQFGTNEATKCAITATEDTQS
ncbi:MAG: hypothetical protein IJL12_05475 [Selenomonadaceae bacterium]|nr:hypothetical protein [Selenomonadaceae bacterium]